jgi:hypothetical protein
MSWKREGSVEQGDHDKLMRLYVIYAQLFEKQARQYR